MQRTISVMVGKWSVNHNNRTFNTENTDPTRSHLNMAFCNTPIKDANKDLFDEAVNRYNGKQARIRHKGFAQTGSCGTGIMPFLSIYMQIIFSNMNIWIAYLKVACYSYLIVKRDATL